MGVLDCMVSTATPKTRLLLVDDEARLTELLKMELEVEGYEVDVAADGATGLIRARTTIPRPDCSGLESSGFQRCGHLPANPQQRHHHTDPDAHRPRRCG